MSTPANPLDNQAAIAAMGQELRDTIGVLISEIIRPTAQQTAANAQAIANTSTNLDRVENVARLADEASSENEQRFETLLAEARADRAEWQANFKAQQEIIQRLLLEVRSTNVEVKQIGDRVTNLEVS